jgi:hypothetical protein
VRDEVVVGHVEAAARIEGEADAHGFAGGFDRGETEAMAEAGASFRTDGAGDFAGEGEECGGFGVLEEKRVSGEAGALLAAMRIGRVFDGTGGGDAAEGPGELLDIAGKAGAGGRERNDAEFVDGAVGIEEAAQEIKALGG